MAETTDDKAATSVQLEQSRHNRSDDIATEIDPRAVGGSFESMPTGYYMTASFIGSFVACCLASMSLFAGFVMPFNIISIINADLGPDPAYVWIPLVYILCASITYALVGRLSDILGRRWFVLGANLLGFVGNIVAGSAHRINVLIGGTALVGIAGAVQLLMPVLMIGELVANKQRPRVVRAVWTSSLPFSMFSPVIARGFVLHTAAGWRWVYYLNGIITGVGVILIFFCYHPPTMEMLHARNRKQIFHYFDFGGILLFTIGLLLFILGLSWGGQQYAWNSGQVIGTIIAGGILLIAFAFYELYIPIQYPLMPPRLWKNIGFLCTVLTASAGAMIYYSLNVIWPLQITALYAIDVMEVGWISCAVPAATIIGSIFGTLTVKNLGHQKYQLIGVTVGMTAFIGAVAASTQYTRDLAIALVTIGSFFVGMIEGITVVTTPLCLEQEDIGVAVGMLGSIRTGLSTIATAVYVAVLTSQATVNIPKYAGAAAVEYGIPLATLGEVLAGFAVGKTSFPNVSPAVIGELAIAYQTAYARSFRVVYLTSIAFGVCAIIAACFTPNLDHRFTDEVARRLHAADISKREEMSKHPDDQEKNL